MTAFPMSIARRTGREACRGTLIAEQDNGSRSGAMVALIIVAAEEGCFWLASNFLALQLKLIIEPSKLSLLLLGF